MGKNILMYAGDKVSYFDTENIEHKIVLMTNKNIKQIASSSTITLICEDTKFGTNLHYWIDHYKNIYPILKIKAKIKQITCMGSNFLYLTEEGDLFFAKRIYNSSKESTTNSLTPTLIMIDPNIKEIASGAAHTLILKHNGELLGFGNNRSKQLENSNQDDLATITMIMNDPNIDKIFCGACYSLILKKTGELQLLGKLIIDDTREQIRSNHLSTFTNSSNIKQISCGSEHVMILKENNDLIVFGSNHHGQLGLAYNIDVFKPTILMTNDNIEIISCYYDYSLIYMKDGSLLQFGSQCVSKNKPNKPTWIGKYENLSLLYSESLIKNWTVEKHRNFPDSFKEGILTFMMYLRENRNKTGLRIPKFVLFEIIKKTI